MTDSPLMRGYNRRETLLTVDLNCLPNNSVSGWSREIPLEANECVRFALHIARSPDVRHAGALCIVEIATDGYTATAWAIPFPLDASDDGRRVLSSDTMLPYPRFQARVVNRTGVPLAIQGSSLEAWIAEVQPS